MDVVSRIYKLGKVNVLISDSCDAQKRESFGNEGKSIIYISPLQSKKVVKAKRA